MHSIKKKLKIFFHTISYFIPYILSTANSPIALPPKAPPTPSMILPITVSKARPYKRFQPANCLQSSPSTSPTSSRTGGGANRVVFDS